MIKDKINPDHYKDGGLEVIDILAEIAKKPTRYMYRAMSGE